MDESLAVRSTTSSLYVPKKSSEEGSGGVGGFSSASNRQRSWSGVTESTSKTNETTTTSAENRPRATSLVDGTTNKKRILPTLGFSKVLQDATRVAEALGRAQKMRNERRDRAMGLDLAPPPSPPTEEAKLSKDVEQEKPNDTTVAVEDKPKDDTTVDVEPEKVTPSEVSEPSDVKSHQPAEEDAEEDDEAPLDESAADNHHENEVTIEYITDCCSERAVAAATGNEYAADAIRAELWAAGVELDDILGVWTTSDGRTGTYLYTPVVSSPKSSPRKSIKQIDDDVYQRLIGKPRSEDIRICSEFEMLRDDAALYDNSDQHIDEDYEEDEHYNNNDDDYEDEEHSATLQESVRPRIKAMSAGERMYFKGAALEQMKQERLQQEREAKVMQEITQISQPVITAKAHNITSDFATRQAAWSAKKAASREAAIQRQELEKQESLNSDPKVHITKRSQKLVGHKNSGPVSDWEARFRKHNQRKNAALPPAASFKPNITSAAARLKTTAPASDRLYEDAAKRQLRREHKLHRALEEDRFDPQTGAVRYAPQTTQRSGSPTETEVSRSTCASTRGGITFHKCPSVASRSKTEADAVIHRLLSHGQATTRRLQKREQDSLAALEVGHKPKLSKVTEEMCAKMVRRPLYEARPKEIKEGKIHGSVLFSKGGNSYGGYGGSSDTATVSSRATTSGDSFAMRSAMHEKQRQAKLEKLRKDKTEQELQNCTFTPSICPISKQLFRKRCEEEQLEDAIDDFDSGCSLNSGTVTPVDEFSDNYTEQQFEPTFSKSGSPPKPQYTLERIFKQYEAEVSEGASDAPHRSRSANDTFQDVNSVLMNWRRLSEKIDEEDDFSFNYQ